jgi:hypothetical protein
VEVSIVFGIASFVLLIFAFQSKGKEEALWIIAAGVWAIAGVLA